MGTVTGDCQANTCKVTRDNGQERTCFALSHSDPVQEASDSPRGRTQGHIRNWVRAVTVLPVAWGRLGAESLLLHSLPFPLPSLFPICAFSSFSPAFLLVLGRGSSCSSTPTPSQKVYCSSILAAVLLVSHRIIAWCTVSVCVGCHVTHIFWKAAARVSFCCRTCDLGRPQSPQMFFRRLSKCTPLLNAKHFAMWRGVHSVSGHAA